MYNTIDNASQVDVESLLTMIFSIFTTLCVSTELITAALRIDLFSRVRLASAAPVRSFSWRFIYMKRVREP